MNHFINFHKNRPVMVELPIDREDNKLPVYLTDKNVIDDYENEYYLVVQIKDIEKYKDYTTKMIEHYVYQYFKYYLKFFSINGDLYLRFEYL